MRLSRSPASALAALGLVAASLGAGLTTSAPAAAQAIDLAALQYAEDRQVLGTFRPGNSFWAHVFTIPDGWVAYGDATSGRLLVTFPTRGDWLREARWEDPALARTLNGVRLEATPSLRRDQVAQLLSDATGRPVMHNATRGTFVAPNARRYGSFLEEWGRIYEHFGIPAEVGLAQAMIESGWNPTVRSEARAVGFCQWLERNWDLMKRLSPHEIEGHNQTTQAMYCAAYLRILATKYGSYIPALSEHHAGGTNVGRTVINGARLGGGDIREQYFLGAQFAVELRGISSTRFRDVVYSYGPRSFLYAEMVFGNTHRVAEIRDATRQDRIHAMRTTRNLPLDEVVRRSGLSADEVRRYNPALIRQVPARATLYLPMHIDDLGRDVAFWHQPPHPDFQEVLRAFMRLDVAPEAWHAPSFRPVLQDFRRRFEATRTEAGTVMATVLAYKMGELFTGRRAEILAEYRTDPRVQALVSEGLRELESLGVTTFTVR
jgi:uncharacterized protein YbdZ (MbtH family)